MPASGSTDLTASQQQLLLQLARAAIEAGVAAGVDGPANVPVAAIAALWLQEPAATFVTLYCQQQLRGCIGSLHVRRSLLVDVCENARAAAFRDPRFPPLRADELSDLQIEVALLSAAQTLPPVTTESALLAQLRPGVDGVIITQTGRRATYLPKVWQHFPDGAAFLASLREKAGLPTEFDETAQYSVYQVQSFSEPS